MAGLVVTCTSCGLKMNAPASKMGARWLCPSCNAVVQALPKNTLALEGTVPPTSPEEAEKGPYYRPARDALDPPAGSSSVEDTCARCGKAFKGDWDRNDTLLGVICHRCSRMAQEPGDELIGPPEDPPPQVREPESYFPMDPVEPVYRPEDEVPGLFKNHPVLFKRMLIGAAACVVGLAAIMFLFPDFHLGEGKLVSEAAAEAPELSAGTYAWATWGSSVAAYIIAIYATLLIYDRINLFEAATNSLYIVCMACVLGSLVTAGAYGSAFGALGDILWLCSLLATAAIVWAAFDLGFVGTFLCIAFATLFGLAVGGIVQAIIV